MSEDTRMWMYRKGEARLFEHPDALPADGGWQRFPLVDGARSVEPLPVKIIGPRKSKKRKANHGDGK